MPVIKYKLISVITDSYQQALGLRYKVLNDSCWNHTDTEYLYAPVWVSGQNATTFKFAPLKYPGTLDR